MTTKGIVWRKLERRLAEPSLFDRLLEEEEEMEAGSFRESETEQGGDPCYQLSLVIDTQDHGPVPLNLLVKQQTATWNYMDSINKITMSGRYNYDLGLPGTNFTDQQGQVIFFLDGFLPLHQQYPPGGVLSKGTGVFKIPPARPPLRTPHIDWEVLKMQTRRDC
jgi:hypothetical protein